MNNHDYETLKIWFLSYTKGFLSEVNADRENILLKKAHTLRVCTNMSKICTNLNKDDQIIALTTALLHDVGRFEQLKRYGTFSDFKSEDHASLGVSILQQLGVLDFLSASDKQVIITAIENHNKAQIEPGLPARTVQLCNLLRDADKLDIWRVVIGYYQKGLEQENPTLVHNLPAGKDVSIDIYKTLINQEIVSFTILETVVDLKVVQMGWIYDINTPQALSLVIERNYLEAIYQTLPATERIKELYKMMQKHLLDSNHSRLN